MLRLAMAALVVAPSLAFGQQALATTSGRSNTTGPTGTLKLCAVEDKTGVPAAYYSITGKTKPVEVKANTCRSFAGLAVGDVQVYQLPEAGQVPGSITVSPASRQDGAADLSNGTVTVDVAHNSTTTVTYINQA